MKKYKALNDTELKQVIGGDTSYNALYKFGKWAHKFCKNYLLCATEAS